jgi:hypothetical protein
MQSTVGRGALKFQRTTHKPGFALRAEFRKSGPRASYDLPGLGPERTSQPHSSFDGTDDEIRDAVAADRTSARCGGNRQMRSRDFEHQDWPSMKNRYPSGTSSLMTVQRSHGPGTTPGHRYA